MNVKRLIRNAAVLAGCLVMSSASFAVTTIKVASVAPARSSWDVEQRRIGKEWADITNGEVELQFMTSDSMGGESGVAQKLKSVRPGQKAPIGGVIFTSLGMTGLVPDCNVLTLCVPFMFRNQEEVNAVLEEFTPRLQKPLNDKGYVILGWFNIGWAYFFTKNPAHTPNELRQQRLSVGGLTSPALSNAFKAAGFLTQDVPIDKLLQSMKTPGGVEGLFTIPMYSYAAQYCKTLTNALDAPLCPVMVTFLISKAEWDAIPEKYKPALLDSVKRAEAKFIEDQKKNDAEYMQRCVDSGMTLFTPTPAELKVWEDDFTKNSHVMYEGKDPVADKDLYQEIVAFLKKYRGE